MMRKLRWVPLGALLLGAAEFVALWAVAQLVGLPVAVIGLIALSLLGGLLVRQQGLRGWRKLRTATNSGNPAGDEVLLSVTGLFAALLLMIPGYLTGLLGLLILIPPVRRLVRDRLRRATERRVSSNVAGDLFGPRKVRVTTKHPPKSQTSEDVIEGEIVD
ncbi:FxsA family protein [Rhizocola hellebori]|uniref:FxsA family protein n=1 Tax=Rhizocola hellebori TaxID=1392758 RepID=UPI0019443B95